MGINKGIEPTQTDKNIKKSLAKVEVDSRYNSANKEYSVLQGSSMHFLSHDTKEEALAEAKADDFFKQDEPYEIREDTKTDRNNIRKPKTYTSQATVNLKIAALKKANKKYPRSLIRSVVRKETNKYGFPKEVWGDELPFQKVPSSILSQSKVEGKKSTAKQADDLADRLQPFLNKLGISLTGLEEYKLKYKAKFNKELTSVAIADIANKIIAINEDRADETTLPEEVAHFAIYALGLDHTLVKSILKQVEHTDLYSQEFEKYNKLYDGDIEQVKLEIAGKLLGAAIVSKNKEMSANLPQRLLNTLQKTWNLFKKKFLGAKDSLDKILTESFGGLATQILEGDTKNFSIEELSKHTGLMAQLDESAFEANKNRDAYKQLDNLEHVLDDGIEALAKKIDFHEGRRDSSLVKSNQSKLNELKALRVKKETTLGIVKYVNIASETATNLRTKFAAMHNEAGTVSPKETAADLMVLKEYISGHLQWQ